MLRKKAFSTNVNSLATKKYLKKEYKRFAHEHFNKDQLREIQRIINFQKKKKNCEGKSFQFQGDFSLAQEEEKVLNKIEMLLNMKQTENKFWDI